MALIVIVGVLEGAALHSVGSAEFAATDPMNAKWPTSRDYDRPALSPVPTAAAEETTPAAVSPTPTVTVSPTPSAAVSPTPTPAEPEPTGAKPESTTVPLPKPIRASDADAIPTESASLAALLASYQEAGSSAGVRYATTSLNLRVGPGADYEKATTVSTATKLAITDKTVDGWRQLIHKDKVLWASEKYLSETKPKPKPAASPGLGSVEPCGKVSGIEGGITNRMTRVARQMCHLFPGISSFGGYRNQSGSLHGSGRAVDAMISGEAGWKVARWARAHASELGIVEILYSQRIWTAQRAGEGWRRFSDRGSATANHYDHVHVGVRSG
ncbi:MAG: hypothetical protein CSA63_01100 [Propionibacterium sp.]|nr:MAG: hypothetical protein CSA63_01100 [Propionibacterium sp.]